jgi:uncharacterized delta-60 repeat protein
MSSAPCGLAPRLAALGLLSLAGASAQTLDASFAPNPNAEVFALAAQADGKILLGGNFTSLGATARNRLARVNADGSLDSAFNPAPNATVISLRVQPDGKILVGGSFTAIGGSNRARLARLNADGSLDAGFIASADAGSVDQLVLQADGKLLIAGLFTQINGLPRPSFARLNADGSLDTAFDVPVATASTTPNVLVVSVVAVQPDGRILIGGNMSTVAGQARTSLARLNADGSLDATFNPSPNFTVSAIVVQPDGKILIGGSFTTVGFTARNRLARLNADGSIDATFNSGADASVMRLALQADGRVLVAGTFSSLTGGLRSRLARVGPDGTLDASFDPNVTGTVGGSSPGVYALVVPGPDQVVFGGAFSAVSGQPRSGLARLGSPLPLITRQPADLAATAGASVTLSVASNVTTGAQYQWRRNGTPLAGATAATLTLANFQAADAGAYTVAVTHAFGTTVSTAATLTLGAPPNAATLALTVAPQPQHAEAGARVTLTAAASGAGVTYQWRKDGVPLAAATAAIYSITAATGADMGYYTVVVSSGGSAIESAAAILTVATPGIEGRLINVSTRGFVPAGGSLTPGFVLAGGGSKRLLVRGVGPTLARFGLAGALADPRLEIVPLGSIAPLAGNDDWVPSPALATMSAGAGAFALDGDSRDSALIADLPAAGGGTGYTVRVGTASATASGLALAEVYDADPAGSTARLINVSTRGFVGTGANALVPGFVIGGAGPRQLLIRAVGPGLAPFGVPGLLVDPQLSVVPLGRTAAVAANDNWGGTPELIAAFGAVGAFGLPAGSGDAAVVVRLPPGAYTVTVSGVGATTGTALVEIYDVP